MPLDYRVLSLDQLDHRPALARRHEPFLGTSFIICRLSARSATRRLSWAFSSSSALRLLASETQRLPCCRFYLENFWREMLCRRIRSAGAASAASSYRMAMIRSVVMREFLIWAPWSSELPTDDAEL